MEPEEWRRRVLERLAEDAEGVRAEGGAPPEPVVETPVTVRAPAFEDAANAWQGATFLMTGSRGETVVLLDGGKRFGPALPGEALAWYTVESATW